MGGEKRPASLEPLRDIRLIYTRGRIRALTYINATRRRTSSLKSSGARNCRAMSFDLLRTRLASYDGTGKVP